MAGFRSRSLPRACALLIVAALGLPVASHAETLAATVHWAERSALGVPASGVIREVVVVPGQRVQRGGVLVRLDDRIATSRVDEASAELAAITPDLAEAKREHERAQDLFDRTLLADHDLQLARNAQRRLQARRRKAAAVLARRRVELEHTTLRAPFDGVVVRVRVTPGTVVSNRLQVTPLVDLAASTVLRARALVTLGQAAELKPGSGAEVIAGERRYPGSVRFVALEPVPGDGTEPRYALDVDFEPDATALPRVGGAVTVELP